MVQIICGSLQLGLARIHYNDEEVACKGVFERTKIDSLKKEEGPETRRIPCVTSVLVEE